MRTHALSLSVSLTVCPVVHPAFHLCLARGPLYPCTISSPSRLSSSHPLHPVLFVSPVVLPPSAPCLLCPSASRNKPFTCVHQRSTKAGKLNQRISRIYRHAIPGYRECTVSVTSAGIFLGTRQFSLPAGRPLREKNLSPGYYRSFDLVSSLPRNSPVACYRSLSRLTLNGRT